MKKIVALLPVALLALASCKKDDSAPAASGGKTGDSLQTQALALFGKLPELVDNSVNPVTDDKVKLGQALYFDPILSKNETQSCNTCHDLATFGVDNQAFSKGDGPNTLGGRNAPTTLNVALHVAQFWDGRAKTVEDQAGGPIMNPVEMGMPSEDEAIRRLKASPMYADMFKKAFPQDTDPVNWKNLTYAIAAFERKLVTPSRFDKYLAGDLDALTPREKKGLKDFMSMGCITCHNGVAIGGGSFQKFGVYQDYWKETGSKKVDEGVAGLGEDPSKKNVFKVPSLRNVAKTYPYFHDGSVRNLKDAIHVMGQVQLDKQLTPEQEEDIAAFFDALTGDVPEDLAKNPHPVAANAPAPATEPAK